MELSMGSEARAAAGFDPGRAKSKDSRKQAVLLRFSREAPGQPGHSAGRKFIIGPASRVTDTVDLCEALRSGAKESNQSG